MKTFLPVLGALLAVGSAATVACAVNSTTKNNTGDDGGTGSDTGMNDDTGTSEDVGSGDSATDAPADAAGPAANIRFANWSPDSPAAGYDLCIEPSGSAGQWQGPLLEQGLGDANTGTLTFDFPTVTTYFQVGVGSYDVEIVAAGAEDCSSPATGTQTVMNLSLRDKQFYTLALVGDTTEAGSDPTLTAVLFPDDIAPTDGSTLLRFLNVAPSLTSEDFGAGTYAGGFEPLEVGVQFARLATMSGNDAGLEVDSNGYVLGVDVADAGPVEFSCHPSSGATGDTATASNQSFARTSAVTFALVRGKTGDAAAEFLVCTGDGTASATSLTSSCTVVSR